MRTRALGILWLTITGCALGPEVALDESDFELPPPAQTSGAIAHPEQVTLRLETRSGTGIIGASLAPIGSAPLSQAHLTIFSFDCGARGRWVSIVGGERVTFCTRLPASSVDQISTQTDQCAWERSFPAGGSDRPDYVGTSVLVREGERLLGRLRITRHTATPREWYLTPDQPFEISLDFLP